MIFRNLTLFNFKNFEQLTVEFDPNINCLVGKNGVGKTNILDALHYLSMTKSAINSLDSSNIRYGEKGFMIKAAVEKEELKYQVLGVVEAGKKKVIKVNKNEHAKLSEHIGLFPVVIISPSDTGLISEGNETRRRYFDSAICQQDKIYLQNLLRYTKALKQRNALLKHFSETMQVDQAQLAPYDHEMLSIGQLIYERRRQYVDAFQPHFNKIYQKLSGKGEEVGIKYLSVWQQKDAEAQFKAAIKKDLILQRTTIGVHRDAFEFQIEGHALKRHGSQGQQKSFLVALKLAQYEVWVSTQESKPVLLLDDIFDKLDDSRMHQMLSLVAKKNFGQIFITDARPERTLSILQDNKLSAYMIELNKGEVKKAHRYEPKKKKS